MMNKKFKFLAKVTIASGILLLANPSTPLSGLIKATDYDDNLTVEIINGNIKEIDYLTVETINAYAWTFIGEDYELKEARVDFDTIQTQYILDDEFIDME